MPKARSNQKLIITGSEAIRANDLHCRINARRMSDRNMVIEVVLPSHFALEVSTASSPSRRSMSRCIYNSSDAKMHCHLDVCCTTSCEILRTCQPCRWVWGWTKTMQLSAVLVLSTPPASPLMQVIDVVLGTQYPGPWKCPSCCSVVAVPSTIAIVIAHSGFGLGTNRPSPKDVVLRNKWRC
jgi:hypothetical protein